MGPITWVFAVAMIAAVPQQHDHKAMNERGRQAMGFDQSKARHTFTKTDDGGTVAIDVVDANDTATRRQIRTHLAEIAKLFKAGDFTKPLFIHAQTPPGADVLKARRLEIDYRYEDTTRGGKVTMTSAHRDIVAAVHRFLDFQKKEHER